MYKINLFMKKTKNIENSQNLDVVHFIEPKCYDVVMQQNNVVILVCILITMILD